MAMKKVAYQVDSKTQCWLVESHRPNGRGYIYVARETERDLIHRVIYRETYGGIPPYNEVHHSCGKKKCINPDHLYLYEAKNNPAFNRKYRPK